MRWIEREHGHELGNRKRRGSIQTYRGPERDHLPPRFLGGRQLPANAANLPLYFNDVCFCLKLLPIGRRSR
jgi:hypothetical protein